jgi:hypothetical protein
MFKEFNKWEVVVRFVDIGGIVDPGWSWSYGSWIYNYLYMQSVPITTDVVGWNLAQSDVYNIM